ncbi:Fluconazole resistance protein 3 [Paramyrothecium foliicola]|nr:Fluconazole resistance protein 3 [Paramyrothecium foliicola]
MDFSGQYQFAGAQPYHQFMSIPPLTPSNSHSTASDDFANTSPPDTFDGMPPSDHFQAFDFPQGPFNGHQQPTGTRFPGPPTPPGQSSVFGHGQHQLHQHQQHQHQPPAQHHHDAINDPAAGNGLPQSISPSLDKSEPSDDAAHGRNNGSEDDDSMTPAQSRRKAQNRAAYAYGVCHAAVKLVANTVSFMFSQRAFRERKEKHVKDLETKLASLEAAQQHASKENERLKRDLQKMSTENEILRATSAVGGNSNHHSPEPISTGPLKYSPTDFYSNVLQHHPNKLPSHRIVTSENGERLLAAGAAWDFIIAHDLFKRGLVDVGNVSDILKTCARCDGQGPVFSERAIMTAIEQSVASGTDDLL